MRSHDGSAGNCVQRLVHDTSNTGGLEPATTCAQQQRGWRSRLRQRRPAPRRASRRRPAAPARRTAPCAPCRPFRARRRPACRGRRRRRPARTAPTPGCPSRTAAPAARDHAARPRRARRRPSSTRRAGRSPGPAAAPTAACGAAAATASRAPGSVARCPRRCAHAVKVRAPADRRAIVVRLTPAVRCAASHARSAVRSSAATPLPMLRSMLRVPPTTGRPCRNPSRETTSAT